MNNRETSWEQNLGRLLQASCGAEARVTPAARHQLRQRLLVECRAPSAPAEFPAVVLGVLTCVLLLLLAGGVLAGLGRGSLPASSTALGPFCALVLLNVLCLPVASFVIVLRRKLCLSV